MHLAVFYLLVVVTIYANVLLCVCFRAAVNIFSVNLAVPAQSTV